MKIAPRSILHLAVLCAGLFCSTPVIGTDSFNVFLDTHALLSINGTLLDVNKGLQE